MNRISLTKINEILFSLDDKYAILYPKFVLVELKYLEKFDKHLLTANSQYGTQQLRESATRELMRQEPEFDEYHTLLAECKIIETRLRNLQQISRNLINQNWSETK